MDCDQAQELITGLVDNELTAAERDAIDAHLAQCSPCSAQLERETTLKRDIRHAAAAIAVPQDLRARIESPERSVGPDIDRRKELSVPEWLVARRWRPAYAFAAVVFVVAALLFHSQTKENIPAAALAMHEKVINGTITLVRVRDGAQLRQQLTRAVNGRFAPVALDLSIIQLHPVAGFFEKVGDRDVLVTVYEGNGRMMTCFTFLGSEADAPKGSKRLLDPDRKINFYAFSRGAVNGVLHAEGEVICVLVSNMEPAELLDVARGKAHRA